MDLVAPLSTVSSHFAMITVLLPSILIHRPRAIFEIIMSTCIGKLTSDVIVIRLLLWRIRRRPVLCSHDRIFMAHISCMECCCIAVNLSHSRGDLCFSS